MPDKMVTQEAAQQALELLLEAASVMRSAGWSWLDITNQMLKRFEQEDRVLGA